MDINGGKWQKIGIHQCICTSYEKEREREGGEREILGRFDRM